MLANYNIKKISFRTSIFELHRLKKCISGLCTNPLGEAPRTQYPNKVKNT